MKTKVIETFLAIKAQKPLVHNITNFVVMNNSANALLAIGASPVMAHAKDELEDILSIASSLVINMGTIDKPWFKAMSKASSIAKEKSLPWMLDPVGAGATSYRTQAALKLIKKNAPRLIRANASEIMAIANVQGETRGVDSVATSELALDSAKTLTKIYQSTIVISGAVDLVVSSNQQTKIENGVDMMTQVTGMGCTASAIAGACLGVCDNSHIAGVTAMGIMGVAGEIAQKTAMGPGSFQMAFIDALYNLNVDQFSQMLRMTDE